MLRSCLACNKASLLREGTSLMEFFFALHEIMHHTHVNKQVGIVLKLDFEKADDKVK
jgi:hypothetical protein